jgi:NAD(P)-dependent dehydrogenase (short-subunit alcohol dehydrogenase family)
MLAVHHRDSAKEADAVVFDLGIEGVYARAFQADLGDGAECAKLVEAVLGWKGRLDVVVNNAAVFRKVPFLGGDDAQWERAWADALDVNLLAPARLARQAAPRMSDGGVFVNLVDIAARQAWPSYAHYGASKAGLEWLTRTLAVALAPKLRVCGVAPGIAEFPADMPEDVRARLVERVPLGRPGTPEAIARAVSYLVGADYVTGSILTVDGGRVAATGENG